MTAKRSTSARIELAKEEYWAEVVNDERTFIENTYLIRTKKATFEHLKFNHPQAYCDKLQTESIVKGEYIRDLILKYRQWGCSTWCLAKAATKTISRRNWRSVICAHHKTRSKSMFRQLKKFWKQIPGALQPFYEADNDLEAILEDRNSSATLSTAKTPEFLRGDMVNWLHLTEIDFFAGEGGSLVTLLDAALPMVPKLPGMGVVGESTANGVDGEFYFLWNEIMEGKNEHGFRAIFVNWKYDRQLEKSFHYHEGEEFMPWAEVKEMRNNCITCHSHRKAWAKAHMTEELFERRRKYGLTWEQMNWYVWQCFTDLRGDWRKMGQEYPCDWQEAFITSGTPVWSMALLEKLRLRSYPGKLFECPDKDFSHWSDLSESELLRVGEDPYFMMWKQPRANHRYMIGGDSGLGNSNSNPCAAVVIDMDTMGVVALLHGRIEPKLFAQYLARLGRYYNNAIIAPEQQNTGYAVLSALEEIYPNIWQKQQLKPEGWVQGNTLGFSTDKSTRPYMVSLGRQLMNAYALDVGSLSELIPCHALIREMMMFTHGKMQKGKAQGAVGASDDIVMAWLIAITAAHQEMGLGLNNDAKEHIIQVKLEEERRIKGSRDMNEYMEEMDRFRSGNHPFWAGPSCEEMDEYEEAW